MAQVLYCENCNEQVWEVSNDPDVFIDASDDETCLDLTGKPHEIDERIERCADCYQYDTVLFMLNADETKRCLDCHNEARGYDLGGYDDGEDY